MTDVNNISSAISIGLSILTLTLGCVYLIVDKLKSFDDAMKKKD